MFTQQFAQLISARPALPWLLMASLLCSPMANAIIYQTSDTAAACGGKCNDYLSFANSLSIHKNGTQGKADSMVAYWNVTDAGWRDQYVSKNTGTYQSELVRHGKDPKSPVAFGAAHWARSCADGLNGACSHPHDEETKIDLTHVPLPSSLLLFGSALFLFGSLRWQRKERNR